MNETSLNNMFNKADQMGWVKLAHSRTCMGPDVEGLKKICLENPSICYIKRFEVSMGFGYKENFYTCQDEKLAQDGRKFLEDGVLK
jgi:hypothetical protein